MIEHRQVRSLGHQHDFAVAQLTGLGEEAGKVEARLPGPEAGIADRVQSETKRGHVESPAEGGDASTSDARGKDGLPSSPREVHGLMQEGTPSVSGAGDERPSCVQRRSLHHVQRERVRTVARTQLARGGGGRRTADENSYVFDFIALRDALQAIVGELDHSVLLPLQHPLIRVEEREKEVEARFEDRRWCFPGRIGRLLPVETRRRRNSRSGSRVNFA